MLLIFRLFWYSGGYSGSRWFNSFLFLVGDQEMHKQDNERDHIPQQAFAEDGGEVTAIRGLDVTNIDALDAKAAKLEDLCLGDVVLPPRRVTEGGEEVVCVHEDVNVTIAGEGEVGIGTR